MIVFRHLTPFWRAGRSPPPSQFLLRNRQARLDPLLLPPVAFSLLLFLRPVLLLLLTTHCLSEERAAAAASNHTFLPLVVSPSLSSSSFCVSSVVFALFHNTPHEMTRQLNTDFFRGGRERKRRKNEREDCFFSLCEKNKNRNFKKTKGKREKPKLSPLPDSPTVAFLKVCSVQFALQIALGFFLRKRPRWGSVFFGSDK